MKLSVCGLVCSDCQYFGQKCNGCREVAGKPFWLAKYKLDSCDLYKCCQSKNYPDCGPCNQLPCRIYDELKDPRMSEAEHLTELQIRVARLKKEVR